MEIPVPVFVMITIAVSTVITIAVSAVITIAVSAVITIAISAMITVVISMILAVISRLAVGVMPAMAIMLAGLIRLVVMRPVVMRFVGLVRPLFLRLGLFLRRILLLRRRRCCRRRPYPIFSFRRDRGHVAAAEHADAARKPLIAGEDGQGA